MPSVSMPSELWAANFQFFCLTPLSRQYRYNKMNSVGERICVLIDICVKCVRYFNKCILLVDYNLSLFWQLALIRILHDTVSLFTYNFVILWSLDCIKACNLKEIVSRYSFAKRGRRPYEAEIYKFVAQRVDLSGLKIRKPSFFIILSFWQLRPRQNWSLQLERNRVTIFLREARLKALRSRGL